ncbi:MAG: LamG domain-containing protein, partial [Planctomycetota bacterium]
LFDDDFEAGDANWTKINWIRYDSNVLGDGNSDGNSHSTYHSMEPGIGVGTLTSDTIDTSEAGATTVELWIKKSADIEAGDINLYYFDGNSWNFAADLNSIGPNDVWLHYTDEVNDSNYFVSTFRLELRSNISSGELFIDDVSVTNTWPIGDEWFVGSYDPCEYNPPGLLDFNTTYYWRVDEVNDSCDASPWQGHLWSFRTEKGKARKPDPYKSAPSKPTDGITLSWTPSCLADQHDIYLSTKFEEVNESDPCAFLGTTYDDDTDIGTGSLAYNKRYYWRVNETGPVSLTESDIWYFQTIGYPLMHFKFDGVLDANIGDADANFVTDDTGNVTFKLDLSNNGELRYDQPNPIYNPAGTSAHFTYIDSENGGATYGVDGKPLLRSCFGADLLDLDGLAYTIEAWIRQDGPANYLQEDIEDIDEDDVYDNDIDGTILKKDRFTYGLGIDDDGAVKFMHRGNMNIIESESGRITEGQWYHIAAVFDACVADANQREKLYIDGLVVATNNDPCLNPSDDYGEDVVGIGAYQWQSRTAKFKVNHFNGAIDELRVVDVALEPGDFLIRGDPNLAWLPRPYNYARDVQPDVDLEWLPGDYAGSHDVFIGTNWDNINDVNSSNYASYPNVDYNHTDVNIYDPEYIGLGQIYYWRVDEVNDTCDASPWKGMIWRFTAASYIIIDDFEAYTGSWEGEGDHPLDEGWADYYANGTNALITLQIDSPVLDKQSMEYAYDNPWLHSLGYCSEAQSLELDPTDWAAYDVNVLTLWFYGWPDNDVSNNAEQMYLSVIDDDGLYAELRYGDNEYEDMNDLKIEAWQAWDIPLTYFSDSNFAEAANDVNLADVNMLIIGFGERNGSVPGGAGYVYFDDIQLNPPFCDTKRIQLAEGDLNVDCAVDFEDVEIMANEWLKGDVNFPEVSKPCEPNLVGWWKLNESDGNDAADSSGKNHHGTLEINDVNVYWVVGYDGNNALEFSGGRVRVPDHQDLRPMHQVSACVWIHYSDEQESARVLVKGPDDRECYEIEVGDDDQVVFVVRDGNDPNADGYP